MRAHLDIKHSGTMGDDARTRMTFDEDSIAHLMSLLTDVYSDPMLAVIREYATNAADSHRAAGITDPIEVELPNSMNPVFVVRDHGTGLSVDDVIDHVSKYGWSSKRDTDDEVGMLGIGFKSALAYTSQFTVVATKGGCRATVLATRDEDGCGALQVIDTTGTDEPNGVEIRVPIFSSATFNEKARTFFRFWEEGTVLIDGEPVPDRFGTCAEDMVIDPDVILTKEVDQHYIVMGNVPYPVSSYGEYSNLVPSSNNNVRAIMRVPIGTVNFTPSREALNYTKRSKEVLDEARAFIHRTIRHSAEQEISKAKSSTEAARAALRWRELVGLGVTLKYEGIEIPSRVYLPRLPEPDHYRGRNHEVAWRYDLSRANFGWSRAKSDSLQSIELADGIDSLHIVGHKRTGVPMVLKQRIALYLQARNRDSVRIYAYEKPFGAPWFDDVERVHVDDLPKLPKPPKVAGTTPRKPAVTHQVWLEGGDDWLDCSDLKERAKGKLVIFVRGGDVPIGGISSRNRYWDCLVTPNAVLVRIIASREAKFLRDYPKAKEFKSWLRLLMQRNMPTPNSMDAAKRRSYDVRRACAGVENLDPACVLDPTLATFIRATTNEELDSTRRFRALDKLGKRYVIEGLPVFDPEEISKDQLDVIEKGIVRLTERYPLMEPLCHTTAKPKDVVDYVNALYVTKIQPDKTRKATKS